jgi:hypothetical protein
MARQIEIVIDDVTAVARLHDEQAPRATAQLWDALPIEATLRHLRWGGMAGFILVDALADETLPLENRVSFCQPATIALRPEHGELAFSYGQAQARDVTGSHWASSVATVEENVEPYLEAVRRTKRGGARRMVIRRREG